MRSQRRWPRPLIDELASAAELFKAFADPHRLRIFSTIAGAREPVCVCHLNDGVPLLQPTISHHLKVLREAGLVIGERHGTWVYYRVTDGALDRLRKHLALATRQEWSYENTSITSHTQDRRKRGVLSKLAERRSA